MATPPTTSPTPVPGSTSSPELQAAQQANNGNNGAAPPAGNSSTHQLNVSRFDRSAGVSRDKYKTLDQSPGVESTRILRYPAYLGNEGQFPHWVVFYPLVRENSALAKQAGLTEVFDQSEQNRMDPQNNKGAAAAAGGIAGAKLGAAMGASLAQELLQSGGRTVGGNGNTGTSTGIAGGLGQKVGSLLTSVGGGAAGAAAGGAAGVGLGALAAAAAGETKLLMGSRAIALHVSEKISTAYSANWEQVELGGMIGAVGAGRTSWENLASTAGDTAQWLLRKTAKIAGAIDGDRLSSVLEAGSKTVENPYKEQLFKSMNFRKFTFDYRFSPKDRSEADDIFGEEGIIQTFLMHMHPERSAGGMFLRYPSEFLIVYYYQGAENQFVRKISNCALQNVAIDYGSEGFTTFQNSGGIPTEATMRLEFIELETLTNERIAKGF